MSTGPVAGAPRRRRVDLRDQSRHATLRQQLDGVDAPDGGTDLVGERLAALRQVGCGGLEQAPAAGEAQRRLEEHLRDRLRALDAALEQVLPAEAHAPAQERVLIECS